MNSTMFHTSDPDNLIVTVLDENGKPEQEFIYQKNPDPQAKIEYPLFFSQPKQQTPPKTNSISLRNRWKLILLKFGITAMLMLILLQRFKLSNISPFDIFIIFLGIALFAIIPLPILFSTLDATKNTQKRNDL